MGAPRPNFAKRELDRAKANGLGLPPQRDLGCGFLAATGSFRCKSYTTCELIPFPTCTRWPSPFAHPSSTQAQSSTRWVPWRPPSAVPCPSPVVLAWSARANRVRPRLALPVSQTACANPRVGANPVYCVSPTAASPSRAPVSLALPRAIPAPTERVRNLQPHRNPVGTRAVLKAQALRSKPPPRETRNPPPATTVNATFEKPMSIAAGRCAPAVR